MGKHDFLFLTNVSPLLWLTYTNIFYVYLSNCFDLDVPPLEDLSELIDQVKTLHCVKESKDDEVASMEKTSKKDKV